MYHLLSSSISYRLSIGYDYGSKINQLYVNYKNNQIYVNYKSNQIYVNYKINQIYANYKINQS